MMPRLLSFAIASLLVFAACGTGDATVTTDVAQATASTVSETTAAPAATDATGTEATTDSENQAAVEPSGVEGPAAPDFSLALGDGSTYQLAADSKPVYLVFWAEW